MVADAAQAGQIYRPDVCIEPMCVFNVKACVELDRLMLSDEVNVCKHRCSAKTTLVNYLRHSTGAVYPSVLCILEYEFRFYCGKFCLIV